MRVSTRARYGLRLMLELALQNGKGPIFLKDIARSQEMSEKYLSQIIIPLRTAGLVNSFRGAHGGYVLQRPPARITVREVVEAVEGEIILVDCLASPSACGRAAQCVTQDVWCRLGKAIAATLDGVTLQNLVDDFRAKAEHAASYAI